MSRKFYLMSSLIISGAWASVWASTCTVAWADALSVIPPQTMATEKPNERVSLQSLKSMRDPFKRIGIDQPDLHDDKVKTELETAPVAEFKMVGVLTGPYKTRALVRGPSGGVYAVSDGTRIGPQNGYVRKVLPDRIIVNEIMQDVVGDKELVTSEIRLTAKNGDKSANTQEHNDIKPVNKKEEDSGNSTLKSVPASQPAGNATPAPALAPKAPAQVPAKAAAAPTSATYGGSNFNQTIPAPVSAPKPGMMNGPSSTSSQPTAGSK